MCVVCVENDEGDEVCNVRDVCDVYDVSGMCDMNVRCVMWREQEGKNE